MLLQNPYERAFRATEGLEEKDRLALRKSLIWAFSWSVPNEDALKGIAACGHVIEIGAGTGYWAWCLRQLGARVDAFDRDPEQPPHWGEVRSGGPEQLPRHPAETLLLSWPPLDEPLALECLEAFAGPRIAYIGEWRGRTADRAFHDRLEQDYRLESEWELPRWPGFQDRAQLWLRRSAASVRD